jgi:hypothetical protein
LADLPVIRQRSKPAQTIGIKKRLTLLDDLLVLLVPRAELFHPGVKAMLDSVTAGLFTPASDRSPVTSAASRMANVLPRGEPAHHNQPE